MQTMQEWMQAHNYQCPQAQAFALDYTDVADCWDRTSNIDYMLIGAWEQAMDGLWDGGRAYLEAWVLDVQQAWPEYCPGDLWPIGSLPDERGRYEIYSTMREFAKMVVDAVIEPRFAATVESDLCSRLRAIVPFNPMANAA